jgi:arsenite/tail-anchored protein-transporting ATPase
VLAKHGLSAVQVPYLDVEVRGVYGLKFLGDTAFDPQGAAFKDLFETGGPIATKFVLFGGKGGVGKTSSSAALAVKLADEGFTTAVVSTDPAHSLGDALDMDLSSGKVTEVPGLPPTATGRLFALEVDTTEAVEEFKEVLRGLGGKKKKGGGGGGLMAQLELGEFADVLESAPPGTDELVALARVLKLLKEGAPDTGKRFDRIIIDTAPTGHTLRLLSFPEFLEGFLERVMAIRERLKGASTLMSMFGGGGGGAGDYDGEDGAAAAAADDGQPKRDRLREFQLKMIELDDLLHDPARAEFVGVTIPTEMAVAETERLVEALKEQDVAIRRLVINQVIAAQASQGYWGRLRAGQQVALADVSRAATEAGVRVTQVPFFDTEMRTVYALRVLADALTKPQPVAAAAAPAPAS